MLVDEKYIQEIKSFLNSWNAWNASDKKEHNAMKEENNERFELYIISNDSEWI